MLLRPAFVALRAGSTYRGPPKRRMFNRYVSLSYLQGNWRMLCPKGVLKQNERIKNLGGAGQCCAQEGFRSQDGPPGGFVQGGISLAHTIWASLSPVKSICKIKNHHTENYSSPHREPLSVYPLTLRVQIGFRHIREELFALHSYTWQGRGLNNQNL